MKKNLGFRVEKKGEYGFFKINDDLKVRYAT